METSINPEQEKLLRNVIDRLSRNLSLTSLHVDRIIGKEYSRSAQLGGQTLERVSLLLNILQRVDVLRQVADTPYISPDPSKDIGVWLNMRRADCDGQSPLEAMMINPEYWLPRIWKNLYEGQE